MPRHSCKNKPLGGQTKNGGTIGKGPTRPDAATQSSTATEGLGEIWLPNHDRAGLGTRTIQAAIDQGLHQLALEPEAIANFEEEVRDKVAKGQAHVILWDVIKSNHLRQLKVSLVVAIPHKLRPYRSILDLLFALRLEDGGVNESVNNTTEKWAPRGAIDQLGHSLKRIIHVFAEVNDNAKILMAKWDIQDGIWRLICRKGEEWNFCYVWPQAPDKLKCLVVPSLLQMGWVKSEPYFCAASETAQDVAIQYIKTRIGSLLHHKFKEWVGANVAKVNHPGLAMILRARYWRSMSMTLLPSSYPHLGRKWYTWRGESSMEYTACSPKASVMAKTPSWQKIYARVMASSKPKNALSASTLMETPKQFG
jgi:hypothetical protein